MQYSRLQRRNERLTKRQSYFLIGASILILVVFIVYGFPAVLNLAGTIGNLSGKKVSSTVNSNVAPSTPRFAEPYEATRSAQVTLSGAADSGISVEIFRNDQSLGIIIAGQDGTFTMDADLSRGDNLFTAVAISESGQKSPTSDAYKVRFLSAPPKLEVNGPNDGDNLKDSPVTVSGKSDPGTTVTVNDHLAIVTGEGSFSYSLSLGSGDNKIKIVVTDQAGNQTTKEITVKYETPH